MDSALITYNDWYAIEPNLINQSVCDMSENKNPANVTK